MTIDGPNSYELLASYPARSRYPRAFLFDEGLHLLVICQWSESLCIDILKSWFETQGEHILGEITKEQARGDEAKINIPLDD